MQLAYQETTRWLRYNALGVGVLGNSALSNRPILHIRRQRGGRDNLHPLSRRSRVVQLAYKVPLNTARFSSRPTSVSGDISIRPTCITSGDNALAVGVLETAPSRVASTCVSGDNVRTPNLSIKKHLKSCNLHIRRQRAGCVTTRWVWAC